MHRYTWNQVFEGRAACVHGSPRLCSVLFALALLSNGVLVAQSLFNKRYGSNFLDYANKAIQTSPGQYLVAGKSFGFGSGSNAILMELDTEGDPNWIRDYAGINADEIHDILESDGNGIMACGGTFSQGAGNWDGFVMRLDNTGNMIWGRTYGNEYGDVLYRLKAYPDGGFLALGYAQDVAISGSQGTLLMKLDPNGDVVWERYVRNGWTPQGSGWYPFDIEVLPDGDILLATLNTGDGNHMSIWRISPIGEMVWSKAYFVRSKGHRVVVDATGNIYITCLVYEGVALSVDMAVLKLDGAGNVLWLKSYGGTYGDMARDIILASDGTLVLCGMTNSFGNGDYDAFLMKMDLDGAVQWCRTYGGVWSDIPYSVSETQDNGFIMAGETYAYGTNTDSLKIYVVRTDSLGITACNSMEWSPVQMEGSVTDLFPLTLSELPQQQSPMDWPSNQRSFTNTSLCSSIGIAEQLDTDLRVLVHPNPFDGLLKISCPQGGVGVTTIQVSDLQGRTVFASRYAASPNGWVESLDLRHIRSGVYILEVRMEERSTTLRIVKD